MENINVTEFIAKSRFSRFHLYLLIVGFVCILFDGYDTAVFGAILPSMMEEWGLTPIEAGALGSYGLFGMLFGALTFGMLADRYGRKRMVAVTVVMFSLFTALCGVAPGPKTFAVCRFLAGMGLAGVLPNAIALLTDYAPKKVRTTLTAVMMCGYCIGGLLSPLLAMVAIDGMGWRFLLWVAAIPLLLLPLVYKFIPESSFILLRDGRQDEMLKVMRRLDPHAELPSNVKLYEEHKVSERSPLADLFAERRGLSTLMFTTAIFFHLILGYGLINWLPKLMLDTGFSMNSSLMFLVVLQCGAIVGTVTMGYAGDRYSLKKILVGLYLLGSAVMVLFALNRDPVMAYVLIAIAGVPVVGAQNLVQVYMSQFYAASMRSTALGFSSSLGRLGGVLGPLLAGWFLAKAFSVHDMFYAFAVPGICSALAISLVRQQCGVKQVTADKDSAVALHPQVSS